jgi:hypothetical protein
MTNTNWAVCGSVTAVTDVTTVHDTNAAGVVQRFYRVTELP